VHLRHAHPSLRRPCARSERFPDEDLTAAATFHGVALDKPDWGNLSHSLAVYLHPAEGDVGFYLIANAFHEPLRFALPASSSWKRLVDTALPSPSDWTAEADAPIVPETAYTVGPNSLVLLIQDTRP
jgi:glycogen operon protein